MVIENRQQRRARERRESQQKQHKTSQSTSTLPLAKLNYKASQRSREALNDRINKAVSEECIRYEANTETQRMQWLMVATMGDAFGVGAKRFQEKFLPALQENSDEIARMREENGEEYAFEKLRQKAEQVAGFKIRYLYEQTEVKKDLTQKELFTGG